MALIEINRQPSARELRWFGVGLLVFAGLIGALVVWRTGSWWAARAIWGAGGAMTVAYFAMPPLRRPVYLGWCYAALPIGWAISHLLLLAIFYLVVTPIAVAMRLAGRDPMGRRFEDRLSYWVPHEPGGDLGRYFRQF
jgi:hypothetical protein